MSGEHNQETKLKCSTCGKELIQSDFGKKWRRCHFCEDPICFNDTHYLGVKTRGLYNDYLDVVPVCKKCYPKEW